MRICFFSDIHGNLLAFESFLVQTKHQEIDAWIFGGDVLGYYYHSDEILDMLRKRNIICLLGNHDQMFLEVVDGLRDEGELVHKYGNSYLNIETKIKKENIDFLRTLKPAHYLLENDLRIGFFHGGPTNPLTMRLYPDTPLEEIKEFQEFDYVFVGHTHHKMVRQSGACKIVNPGSLGQQRDGRGCSYIIFDTASRKINYYTVSYDRNRLVEEIERMETQSERSEKLKEVLFRKKKEPFCMEYES